MSGDSRAPLEPALGADFAEQVLRQVDRVRRRRRWASAGVAGVVVAAALVLLRPPPSRHRPAAMPVLAASDFAWLETAGADPGDPEAMLFPDPFDARSAQEGNPLVAVAENL